jgi:hypothetical protein
MSDAPKVDGLGFDLLDAGTGTDGLVVQAVAGCGFLVRFRPFGVDRIGKGCAGAGDIGGGGGDENGITADDGQLPGKRSVVSFAYQVLCYVQVKMLRSLANQYDRFMTSIKYVQNSHSGRMRAPPSEAAVLLACHACHVINGAGCGHL